jgi:hypothetical protein
MGGNGIPNVRRTTIANRGKTNGRVKVARGGTKTLCHADRLSVGNCAQYRSMWSSTNVKTEKKMSAREYMVWPKKKRNMGQEKISEATLGSLAMVSIYYSVQESLGWYVGAVGYIP